MSKVLQIDIITKNFILYLNSLNISKTSIKLYKSDLSHFAGWLILRTRAHGSYVENLTDATPFINKKTAHEYKEYLVNNQSPISTVNRKLSSLRHLGRMLEAEQAVGFDFMIGIENCEKQDTGKENIILSEFRNHLEDEKVSPNTIKSYLSDIKQFLSWYEKSQLT